MSGNLWKSVPQKLQTLTDQVLEQGYSITNSVGPDFQTKKVSWASYFSGETTRNDTF